MFDKNYLKNSKISKNNTKTAQKINFLFNFIYFFNVIILIWKILK